MAKDTHYRDFELAAWECRLGYFLRSEADLLYDTRCFCVFGQSSFSFPIENVGEGLAPKRTLLTVAGSVMLVVLGGFVVLFVVIVVIVVEGPRDVVLLDQG